MYESFYKLSGKPFQLLPDTNIVFPSSGHKRALSYMVYGLEQGEGFIVITGDVGTGKTTLIQTLLADIKKEEIVPINIAAANMDDTAILHSITEALELGLDGSNKVIFLRELKKVFGDYQKQGKRVVIIIDEAQTLSWEALEELRILTNLEAEGKALLQVFLVGQPELRKIINSKNTEQLQQRIIASYNLAHLTDSETKEYILYRLKKVGWDNDPSISEGVFTEIFEWSEGVPRKVNLVCDRLFLYEFLEELHTIQKKHVETVIAEMDEEVGSEQGSGFEKEKPKSRKKRTRHGKNNSDGLAKRIEKLEESLDELAEDFEHEKKLIKLLVKNIDL